MQIQITEVNWTATVLIAPQAESDDILHCEIRTIGATLKDALAGATIVSDLFAKHRTAFIRAMPEAASDTNFDTKETKHCGYARFSFKLESGAWHLPETPKNTSIGLAESRA